MNINILKDSVSDSKQPVVYDLGTVTTTLQALLDNSRITITDKQVILLKVTQDATVSYYFLPFKDYNGDSLYGYGKEIVVADLIPVGGSGSSVATPTIAQVLTAGSIANNGQTLTTRDGSGSTQTVLNGNYFTVSDTGGINTQASYLTKNSLSFIKVGIGGFLLKNTNVINSVLEIPNSGVTSRTLPVSVNGTYADTEGNITISTGSSAIVERGVFSGAFALTSGIGGEYTPLTQTGALTFSVGGSAVNGGIDSVKITANGSAITVPGGWINIGSDTISIVNGAINRIMVRQYQNEIWYSVKVN